MFSGLVSTGTDSGTVRPKGLPFVRYSNLCSSVDRHRVGVSGDPRDFFDSFVVSPQGMGVSILPRTVLLCVFYSFSFRLSPCLCRYGLVSFSLPRLSRCPRSCRVGRRSVLRDSWSGSHCIGGRLGVGTEGCRGWCHEPRLWTPKDSDKMTQGLLGCSWTED